MNEKKSDGAVLHEAIDGIVSEFMDEYVIVGKKAGAQQKMLVSTLESKTGFLGSIYNECLKWAYLKEKGEN